MNKKAQVGNTLTWMVAFVIIFFIMLLFVTSTIILTGKKDIPVIGEGSNAITLGKYSGGDYKLQRDLSVFLFSNVKINGKDSTFFEFLGSRQTFSEDDKNIVKNKMKESFSDYERCYALCIGYSDKSFIFKKEGCTSDEVQEKGFCEKLSKEESPGKSKASVILDDFRIDLIKEDNNE